MSPGDIVIVDFQGAAVTKRRPALVVSTSAYHDSRPDVILAVITTRINAATSPFDHVLTDWRSAGLRKASAARTYLGTYRQRDVSLSIGKLSDQDWSGFQKKLKEAIAVGQ